MHMVNEPLRLSHESIACNSVEMSETGRLISAQVSKRKSVGRVKSLAQCCADKLKMKCVSERQTYDAETLPAFISSLLMLSDESGSLSLSNGAKCQCMGQVRAVGEDRPWWANSGIKLRWQSHLLLQALQSRISFITACAVPPTESDNRGIRCNSTSHTCQRTGSGTPRISSSPSSIFITPKKKSLEVGKAQGLIKYVHAGS